MQCVGFQLVAFVAVMKLASSTRRTGCMLPVQLCAIISTSHKPAKINKVTKTRAIAFTTIIIDAFRAFVFQEVWDW